jgi:uncharacterized protein
MMHVTRVLSLALALGLSGAPLVAGGDTYAADEAKDRAERLAELTKPEGWLSLIGLHFVGEGTVAVGSDKANGIVLSAGPARLGTLRVASPESLEFIAAPGVEATVDGARTSQAVLQVKTSSGHPSVVRVGTLSFFPIVRGGHIAIRVRDSASERLRNFLGIDYFPIDPSWRIEARWVPFEQKRTVEITNIIGNVMQESTPGKAVFERDGITYELIALADSPTEPLFFVIADATSGKETYRMRFLGAEPPKDGKVILDFNLAENPPCGFTPFATCPLPPKGNRLTLAITAGEKVYRGSHE